MFKVYGQLLLDSPAELCTLERVDVSDNGITAEPCTTLMAALSRHENLVALNLSGNKVGVGGCKALSKLLQVNNVLTELKLARMGLSTECLEALLPVMSADTTLKFLDLADNKLGAEDGKIVAQMIEYSKVLELLDLSWNRIHVMPELTASLALNKQLKTLKLGWNGLGDDEIASIAQYLCAGGNIKSLHLGGNCIGEKAAVMLADALGQSKLQFLDLSGNVLGRTGVFAILQYVSAYPKAGCEVLCSKLNPAACDPMLVAPTQDPAGQFKFNLSDMYDRAVCRMFGHTVKTDTLLPSAAPPVTDSKIDGSKCNLDFANLPQKGILEFRYQ